MKNKILMLMIGMFVVLTACEQENPNKINDKPKADQTFSLKSGGIRAMHINNGGSSNCANNILVFPDWETFHAKSALLEDQWEQHVSDFSDNVPPGLTESELNAYADSLGFQEEQPYLDFEAAYQFCSLRKMLYDWETNWLASLNSIDEMIDKADEDPDDHYIWYEDRALLNEQAEVIVQDSLGKNVIYKFVEGGLVTIENDRYDLLRQLNPINPPRYGDPTPVPSDPPVGTPVRYYENDPCGGFLPVNLSTQAPWNNFPGDDPDSDPCDPTAGGGGGIANCKGDNDSRQYFNVVDDNHVIKTVDKYRQEGWAFGNRKVKAKTKYYILGPGGNGMHRNRGYITAKLEAIDGIECNSGFKPTPESETAYSSKVKAKWDSGDLNGIDPNLNRDDIHATHKAYDDVFVIDMYNGNVQ